MKKERIDKGKNEADVSFSIQFNSTSIQAIPLTGCVAKIVG